MANAVTKTQLCTLVVQETISKLEISSVCDAVSELYAWEVLYHAW